MFQVKINLATLRKIAEHTRKPYEQIGLLIGGFNHNGLMINDAIKGESDSNGTSSVLTAYSLAKVAQNILTGKIRGRIVGWYHSHIGCGIFMSEQDIQTQMKLQQFSSYIVALIIDPHINEFGLFTLLENNVLQIPEDQITIYM